jgi:hypothetical protein
MTQEIFLVNLCKLFVLHLFDICSCCERFRVTSQDDGMDRIVGREGGEGRVEFGEEGGVES